MKQLKQWKKEKAKYVTKFNELVETVPDLLNKAGNFIEKAKELGSKKEHRKMSKKRNVLQAMIDRDYNHTAAHLGRVNVVTVST